MVNYGVLFERHGIYKIEELKSYKENIKIASMLENELLIYNNNIDEIRKFILLSFKLDKRRISYKNRFNYIRGMIYSNTYVSYEDYLDIINTLSKSETNIASDKIFNRTAFSERFYSDKEDSIFFSNYMDSFYNPDMVIESMEKSSFVESEMSMNSLTTVDDYDYDDDLTDSSDVIYSYKVVLLKIPQRVKMIDKNFPSFVSSTLATKDIKRKKDRKEYEMVVKGMKDYYSLIMNMVFDYLTEFYNDKRYKSKNLSLNI